MYERICIYIYIYQYKLADKIDDIPNNSFLDYLNNLNFNSMVLSTISASEIYLAINIFKPKVSRDELDISMEIIQEISSSIIFPLMYIINKSFFFKDLKLSLFLNLVIVTILIIIVLFHYNFQKF